MSYKQISPIIVAEGGTGAQTFTSHGVLIGNTTGAITATAAGTNGQVLTGVTGGAPTFQALPSSSITITGDTGGGLTGTSFTFTGGTTGLSFGGSGTTETLTFAGITANGGTVSLATDATASTINIATGAGAKTTTLGSTNTTSSTAIKSGSGNIAMNSGLTVDSSGRWTSSVQPAFFVGSNADQNNVTGTSNYTVTWDTEVYDQGSNFASNTFTAPVTGKYNLWATLEMVNVASVGWTFAVIKIVTTSTTYQTNYFSAGFTPTNDNLSMVQYAIAPMTAGDTATVQVRFFGGTDVVDIQGNTGAGATTTYFTGQLFF